MSVMWSSASFCSYLMAMLNKYLEGTLYTNVLLDGFAGLLAAAVASYIYTALKLRGSFIFSFSLTLVGGILIYAFEAELIPHRGAKHYDLNTVIPILAFATKMGIGISF